MNTQDDNLFKVNAAEYGKKYREHYLAMYLDYVASADRISDRRHSANQLFLSVNAALLGLTGYLGGDGENLVWLGAAAGILFSLTWRRLIRSYRNLNAAKFNVINQLEQRLPFAAYDEEWVQLKSGLDKKVHKPFSKTEEMVPIVFLLLHGTVLTANFFLWGKVTFGW